MNTMQLECFLAVADTLNFAKAAVQLNVTQPAVTQQIHSLENELGVRLFRRNTRSVELTVEGGMFMKDAETILLISDRAKKKFAHTEEHEWEYFNIGTHTYGEIAILYHVLGQMREEYPNFHPIIQAVPFQHLFQLLEEDEVEVIVSFRETYQKENISRYMELARVPITAVMPRSNPLAGRETLQAGDLAGNPLILIDPKKSPKELSQFDYQLMEDRAVSEIYFCESVETAMTLSKGGYGIAAFPDIGVWDDPAMVEIPIQGLAPASYGAYYKSTKGKPMLKRFLQLTKAMWEENGKHTVPQEEEEI